MKYINLLVIVLFSLFISCTGTDNKSEKKEQVTVNAQELLDRMKYHPNDPFKDKIVESEFFEVSGLKDEVIEGKDGTVIVVPKGAFLDKDGNVVEKKIKIELAEPDNLQDIINTNLADPETQKKISNGAMIYINATADGEALVVNQDNPVYVEIPTAKKESGAMVFRGVRDENGVTHWTEDQQLEKFLIPVPIQDLDFLPEGFTDVFMEQMPEKYHKYDTATLDRARRTYYEMSNMYTYYLYHTLMGPQPSSFMQFGEINDYTEGREDCKCGILPASIKALYDKRFNKTLIATREFEARIKDLYYLYNYKMENIIELLDSPLWKIDLAIAKAFEQQSKDMYYECRSDDSLDLFTPRVEVNYNLVEAYAEAAEERAAENNKFKELQKKFEERAKERLTNVEGAGEYARLLRDHYSRSVNYNRVKMAKVRNKYVKKEQNKMAKAQQVEQEYTRLLKKREKYRMEKYGFKLRNVGWLKVGTYITLDDLPKFTFEVKVNNGANFDRVHTYIIDPSIDGIYSTRSSDKINFLNGDSRDPNLLLHTGQEALALSVGYKGDDIYYLAKPFRQSKVIKLEYDLELSTSKEFYKVLNRYNYKKINSIVKDLRSQAKFFEEQKRQDKKKVRLKFELELAKKAFPSCYFSGEDIAFSE